MKARWRRRCRCVPTWELADSRSQVGTRHRTRRQPAEGSLWQWLSAPVHMVDPMHAARIVLPPCVLCRHVQLTPIRLERARPDPEREKRDMPAGGICFSERSLCVPSPCRLCCSRTRLPISTAGTCARQEGTSGSKRALRGCPIVSRFCAPEGRRAFFLRMPAQSTPAGAFDGQAHQGMASPLSMCTRRWAGPDCAGPRRSKPSLACSG